MVHIPLYHVVRGTHSPHLPDEHFWEDASPRKRFKLYREIYILCGQTVGRLGGKTIGSQGVAIDWVGGRYGSTMFRLRFVLARCNADYMIDLSWKVYVDLATHWSRYYRYTAAPFRSYATLKVIPISQCTVRPC